MELKQILRPVRTEHAKIFRRKHGDRGGRFQDKLLLPSGDEWSNTVSTVTKDNLLCVTFY